MTASAGVLTPMNEMIPVDLPGGGLRTQTDVGSQSVRQVQHHRRRHTGNPAEADTTGSDITPMFTTKQ